MEKQLIKKLVQAMEIEKGEIVLLNFWGTEEETEKLYEFAGEVAAEGAFPMPFMHFPKYYEAVFERTEREIPEKWMKQFEAVDVVIDIMNYTPGIPPEGLTKEKYGLYGAYLQKLFGSFGKKKKLIQITMPTEANANMTGIPIEQYKERVQKALDIDYTALKEECEKKIDGFGGSKRIIRTGENCVLNFDTEGRVWIADAGDGSLPCGEVYVAPVEEQTNGTVFFEKLMVESLGMFEKVTVTIKDGRIVGSDCSEFIEFIKGLPEGGDIVAEVGIGMNPNVSCSFDDTGLDENAIGTFHIGIGMNHLFGGKNKCPVHMDFVGKGIVE